ncbi:MAG: phosphotransferase, partial [Hyphomicrobium sp.]|nr:phosphotransferase [Hyphomicrobium sp.]
MAVYTEISDDDLVRFLESYPLGTLLSCKGIAEGVENTNYLVRTEQGPFILTLYEKRVHREDLPFFLGLMEHLAQNGLSCPTPVRDRHGVMLQELAGRPAALVTFLDGVWIRRPRVDHCAAVGKALAELHLAGRGFEIRRENALGLA